jgi:hypothetical protein
LAQHVIALAQQASLAVASQHALSLAQQASSFVQQSVFFSAGFALASNPPPANSTARERNSPENSLSIQTSQRKVVEFVVHFTLGLQQAEG